MRRLLMLVRIVLAYRAPNRIQARLQGECGVLGDVLSVANEICENANESPFVGNLATRLLHFCLHPKMSQNPLFIILYLE